MTHYTDWCCAGCRRQWMSYPPIKIPTGKLYTERYPAIGVEYNRYCYKCALAILFPTKKRRWSLFGKIFSKITKWRDEYDLEHWNEERLEHIYDELPGR